MTKDPNPHGLEFLLAFDGRIHHLEEGYWLKFEIKRVKESKERPHGLSYSFTLHAPDGARLIGFDNAHGAPRSSKFKRPPATHDHRHGLGKEQVKPYAFKDADTLLDDFFNEVDGALKSRGISTLVVRMEEKEKPK
jgi:hypothetical protein